MPAFIGSRRILSNAPGWVLRGAGIPATLDFDFQRGRYYQQGKQGRIDALLTCSRASNETSLLPTSASGAVYLTFSSNAPAIVPGLGLQVYETRTNVLLNSTAPATQTTASLGTGTYTLWVNGAGSATSSAGTATGSGFGAATNGVPNIFTLTGAGTVVVTVAGALNAFQIEAGTFGTPLIVTAGTTVARAGDFPAVMSPPIFGPALSLFAKATPRTPDATTTNQILFTVNDGTASNRVQISRDNSLNFPTGTDNAGGVTWTCTTDDGSHPLWGVSVPGRMAMRAAPSDQELFFEGYLGINHPASIAGPPIGLNAIHVGARFDGLNQFNGIISRVALWAGTGLSSASLGSLSNSPS